MGTPTHETWEEWLQMDFDGELGDLSDLNGGRQARLREHEASCAACTAERASLLEVARELREAEVAVRPDFTSAVMSALPPAGWESRHARAWAVPAALIAGLGGAAAIVAGVSAAQLRPGGQVLGAFRALFDLFSTAALAGAGLLQASWRGVGLALGDALSGSWVNMAAFGIGVLGLNLVLLRLLRKGRTAEAMARRRR
ncbi:MAG: hypothetical protein ABI609_00175 [Acidobacteriota bacterium]